MSTAVFEGQPPGFPFGEFDVMDVMLPEGDDMGIPSDEEDEEEEVVQEDGFANIVVVDKLPQVSQEKYDKLTSILKKIFGASGRIREGGLHHPVDESTNMSKGFAFVEYETREQARAAQQALHGYVLDKNHTFTAISFEDLERLKHVPETYEEPEPKPFQPPKDLWDWLSDKRGRDQFCVRHGDECQVFWNDAARGEADLVYSRPFWTDAPFLLWSPRGSYVATLHPQGAVLWGGPEFRQIRRFPHPAIQRASFSPCERYIYTFCETPPEGRGPPGFVLKVSEVRTGKVLRAFEGSQAEHAVGSMVRPDGGMKWPAFKWSNVKVSDGSGSSSDDSSSFSQQFLAVVKRNAISVYSTPDMGLLDKKSLKTDGVAAFEWSPADPMLCVYQEEHANMPARVVLIQVPSREEVRAKNLFSVADVRMAWHPQGDYLAVRVEKWSKARKSTTTNLEIFSLRQRNVPVDMLELPNKAEKILALAWEPTGHRFAILHGEPARPSVSLYTMKDPKGGAIAGVHALHTMHNRPATSLHWSPAGRFLLLAGLKGGMNGKLEWWDADDLVVVGAGEHFMATEVEWDPTGRYVATSVTAVNQMENGFMVWSFTGTPLYKVGHDRLFQFSWRPRPPCLLSAEKQKEIAKNLKSYGKRYEEEDEALLAAVDSEAAAERRRIEEAWKEWQKSKERWVKEQIEGAKRLLGTRWKEPETEYRVEEVEVSAVIDIREEVVKA